MGGWIEKGPALPVVVASLWHRVTHSTIIQVAECGQLVDSWFRVWADNLSVLLYSFYGCLADYNNPFSNKTLEGMTITSIRIVLRVFAPTRFFAGKPATSARTRRSACQ